MATRTGGMETLVTDFALRSGVSQREARRLADLFLDSVEGALQGTGELRLNRFGTLKRVVQRGGKVKPIGGGVAVPYPATYGIRFYPSDPFLRNVFGDDRTVPASEADRSAAAG